MLEKDGEKIKSQCKKLGRWGAFCLQRCGDCLKNNCDPLDGTCLQGCRSNGYVYGIRCTNEGGSMLPSETEAKHLYDLEQFWYKMRSGFVKNWAATCSGLQKWGMFCLFKCPINCLLGCELDTGNCRRRVCRIGYTGSRCEETTEGLQYQKAFAVESASNDKYDVPVFTLIFVILSGFGIISLCFVVQKSHKTKKKQEKENGKKQKTSKCHRKKQSSICVENQEKNNQLSNIKIESDQLRQTPYNTLVNPVSISRPAAQTTTTNINQMMKELREGKSIDHESEINL
ncbi:unnamed protein product [Dimorphilus gyrociliatus]|uniref:Uncharacterized protein n=1 Tax=Dimorphilus gyrociliatus TaxID=2664684 RepID=A0A7I8WBW0_9ANNE|nr:unnamed protein product [Dimorphilus gyrociliatus]